MPAEMEVPNRVLRGIEMADPGSMVRRPASSRARHALSRTLAEYGYGSQYSAAPMPYPYGPGGMAGGYDPLAGLPPRSLFTPGVTPSAPRSRPSSAPPGGEGAEDAWGGLVDSMSSAVGEIA